MSLPMPAPIQIFPLPGLPEIRAGDDLAALIAAKAKGLAVAGDIFVVAQKIVSKAEGRVVRLDTVAPSRRALEWAEQWDRDARVIELVLREARSILRMERGLIIAETRHGFICANAGVDISNAPDGAAVLLPADPDASARALQREISRAFGIKVAVIIADTFGRAWREGLVNIALGVAGLNPLRDYRGAPDAGGRVLETTVIAAADEIAAAAELVMGKADNVPVAVVRGAPIGGDGTGRDLLRPMERDLFR